VIPGDQRSAVNEDQIDLLTLPQGFTITIQEIMLVVVTRRVPLELVPGLLRSFR
jgi:hypothetical protein